MIMQVMMKSGRAISCLEKSEMLSYAKKGEFWMQELVDDVCCVDKAGELFIGGNERQVRNNSGFSIYRAYA